MNKNANNTPLLTRTTVCCYTEGMTLSEFLAASNLSHADFASRVGVTKEAVRLWAVGARTPRPAAMLLIARATDGRVTANDFVRPDVFGPAPAGEAAA